MKDIKKPLVSIITPVLNGRRTIESTIGSITDQTYENIEHIIIDNGSTDGTLELIDKYRGSVAKILLEDVRGIYTTINRGLKAASGEIVGILNADDFYAHNMVIENVVSIFENKALDSLYGDLVYVNKDDPDKVLRYWKAKQYSVGKMRWGWMPPHPAFFVRRETYKRYGFLNDSFKIAADYELILRLLYKNQITTFYSQEILVKMRWGGASNKSFKNVIEKTWEDYRACRMHGLGFFTVFMKNLRKIPQFII